jgi:hypothetical protein
MSPDRGIFLFLLGMPASFFASYGTGHTGVSLLLQTTLSWIYVIYIAIWS